MICKAIHKNHFVVRECFANVKLFILVLSYSSYSTTNLCKLRSLEGGKIEVKRRLIALLCFAILCFAHAGPFYTIF